MRNEEESMREGESKKERDKGDKRKGKGTMFVMELPGQLETRKSTAVTVDVRSASPRAPQSSP